LLFYLQKEVKVNRSDFEKLKEGLPPSKLGLDNSEAIQKLCSLIESTNEHLNRLDALRKRYNKLDDFICDQLMQSCFAFKDGLSAEKTIKNIFNFYEENCT